MQDLRPGAVILFGSGETSPSSGKTHEYIASQLTTPFQINILETPAGFQPNSSLVAQEVADFMALRLQNYAPQIRVIPARQKGTSFSPDDPQITEPLWDSDWIFLGPGSPTYAVRQLQYSLAYHILVARHRLGATLMLASAGVLALSAYVLPVYEVYKAGEDLHWQAGLDFFGAYGLSLVFIPHWNNTDGGVKLDTSHCYMGKERFQRLVALLPAGQTIVGLDEHTSLIMELSEGRCRVMGRGGVILLRGVQEEYFRSGSTFPCDALGDFRLPASLDDIPMEIWQQALERRRGRGQPQEVIPDEVRALVAERQHARLQKDWARADQLRAQIASLGWEVRDTPQGVEIIRK